MSEKKVENEEFTEFAQTALREPRKGVYEEMLALHLVNGTLNTKPATIISHIAAAVMMVQKKDVEQLDLDLELLKTIYAVNSALSHPYEHKFDKANSMTRIYWGFESSKENFQKYIKPWFVNFNYHPQFIGREFLCAGYKLKHQERLLLTPNRNCDYVFLTFREQDLNNEDYKKSLETRFKFPFTCPKCGRTISTEENMYLESTTLVNSSPFELFFFEASQCLTGEGYTMLVNAFVLWAMPIVQKAKAQLAKLVTPTLYNEMLKMLKTEAEPRESSMGSTE